MMYRPGPQGAVIGVLAALALALLTACNGGAAGPEGSTSSEVSPAATGSANQVGAAAAPSVVGGTTGQVCQNLLAIDSVPVPDSGPADDPAANAAYGNAVGPLLAAAVAAAPAAVVEQLNHLVPIIAAAGQGAALPVDDPAMLSAIASYESWAHASCGYQQVDLMAMDYEFDGAPADLAAGPTSLSLMNHSAKGESHIAALGRLRPGQQVGPKELVELSFQQLDQYLEVLPNSAAASPGQTVGILVDLTPGHYFLLCPSQSDDADPTTGHLYKGMLAEFDVR